MSASLGIDFGTSHTAAALRRPDGRVESVLFDGSPLLPSAVYAGDDGRVLVGRDARDAARLDPSRFEPHPKRRVDDGTVLLGESEIAVGDLFAAVLARVRSESERVLGAAPADAVLTHPAAWGPTRRLVLQDAARAAGFADPALLPEPVAAAAYYVAELGHRVPVGSAVVVHDFGGGTFDASVVRRTETGFEVLAVDGIDDLGGVDIDNAVIGHLRHLGDDDQWRRLLTPGTAAERRQWRGFHDDVREAKERLSRQSTAELFIPVLDREVHLTRDELESLTRPLLARAPKVVEAVIRASGLPDEAIAGIFLVGGASRMPLVATLIHRELGRPATVIDRLEQVVAHGALLAAGAPAPLPVQAPAPLPVQAPVPVPAHAQPVAPPMPAYAPQPYQPSPYAPPAPERAAMPAPLWVAAALLGVQALIWLWVLAVGPVRFWGLSALPLLAAIPLLRVRRPWALAACVSLQVLGALLITVRLYHSVSMS